MKPITPTNFMKQEHWDLISVSIACNIPSEYGATDKGMVGFLARGGV